MVGGDGDSGDDDSEVLLDPRLLALCCSLGNLTEPVEVLPFVHFSLRLRVIPLLLGFWKRRSPKEEGQISEIQRLHSEHRVLSLAACQRVRLLTSWILALKAGIQLKSAVTDLT